MSFLAPTATISAEGLWRWGRVALWSGLGLGLLLVCWLAWALPTVLSFFPLALLGGLALTWLFQHPLANLCVVLGGYVLISDYTDGLQVTEVLYGLYYLAYLGGWYAYHLTVRREPLAPRFEDKAVLTLLCLATASLGLGVLFGGTLALFRGDWLAFSMLAFYFPIRDACLRYPNAARWLVVVLLWLVVFTAFRNFVNYRRIILEAVYAWEVTTGRTALNELFLMCGSLGATVGLLYLTQWRARLGFLLLFLLSFAGLILTQSRGYWVSFALGLLVLFVLTDRQRRAHIVMLFGGGALGAFLLGLILFPQFTQLIVVGLVDRVATLGSAATDDLSLVNRFYESRAIWDRIVLNPIIGYGFGAPYSFHDLTLEGNRIDTFIHNGYIATWFKLGLIGLVATMVFWLGTIWRGIQLFRGLSHPRLHRLLGLTAAVCLISELLVANTSNPFAMGDGTLTFALLAGIVSGCSSRTERPAA